MKGLLSKTKSVFQSPPISRNKFINLAKTRILFVTFYKRGRLHNTKSFYKLHIILGQYLYKSYIGFVKYFFRLFTIWTSTGSNKELILVSFINIVRTTVFKLLYLSVIPILYRAIVAGNTAVYFSTLTTNRTRLYFSG